MSKKQLLANAILLALLSFICIYIYDNYKVETETKLIVEKGKNKEEIVEYLTNQKNNNYYLYNIDNIIVDYSDRVLDLNRALETRQITIDEVLTYLTKKFSLNDEKNILYQNDDFSVLICKLDNDKTNYIFGDSSMNYNDNLCNEKPYLCAFTKTYHVLDITEGKNNDYIYLTLKNDVEEEVSTIQIDKNKVKSLEANDYYAFKFASTNNIVDGSIKEIFDNNDIIDITPLKIEDSKVNENICK